MATYSDNLKLILLGTGEGSGTWGDTTNTNLGTLLEQAISGYATQAIADGADTIITIPDGATGVARNMIIECTGALTAARNLIVPSNQKLYFVYNNTTGGYAVTVKVSGQTGVSVPNGAKMVLMSNGYDIVEAINTDACDVTYDPPFTGGVSYPVCEKLAQTVSVKDFGAVGDGATDDTTAIQAALDSGATTINLPDGTYIVENLTISDSIVFQGTGTLKWKDASVDSLLTLEASSIVIDGITFDGNSTSVTQESVPMIAFDTAPYLVLKNCTFQYIHYATVITDVDNSPYGRVENCTFKSIAKTIVSSGYNLAIKSSFWTIIGCVFQDFVNSHAVRAGLFNADGTTPVRGTKVIGCQFNDISSGGGVICELYAQDTVVVGNNFTDCEQSWKVEAAGNTTKNNVFGLNTVRGTTNPVGANMTGTRNIAGLNIFEDCVGGITIGSECAVIGNLFYNCGDLASTASVMEMYSTYSRSIVSNNIITTSAYRGMNINSDDVIISSNLIKGCNDRSLSVTGDRVKLIGNNIDGGTYGILSNSQAQDLDMTNNYVVNASTTNYSISDQTTAIIDSTNYNYPGYLFSLTIASGAVTSPVRQNATLKIDTEGAAASDDLDTITPTTGGGYVGQVISLKGASSARVVTAKDNTGNLRLAGDFAFTATADRLLLEYDGANWIELSRSDNA
jgi:hypothetical protein